MSVLETSEENTLATIEWLLNREKKRFYPIAHADGILIDDSIDLLKQGTLTIDGVDETNEKFLYISKYFSCKDGDVVSVEIGEQENTRYVSRLIEYDDQKESVRADTKLHDNGFSFTAGENYFRFDLGIVGNDDKFTLDKSPKITVKINDVIVYNRKAGVNTQHLITLTKKISKVCELLSEIDENISTIKEQIANLEESTNSEINKINNIISILRGYHEIEAEVPDVDPIGPGGNPNTSDDSNYELEVGGI